MSRERLDKELHDFLDGRLTESERAAFEARLKQEPELARRLQAYRAAGRALREAPPALPPGFYSRARARFEDSLGSRPPRRRWIYWKVAGLATAGLILAALILPDMLPPPSRAPAEQEDQGKLTQTSRDLDEVSKQITASTEDVRREAEDAPVKKPESQLRLAKEADESRAAPVAPPAGASSGRKDAVARNEAPVATDSREADALVPASPARHAERIVGGGILQEEEEGGSRGVVGNLEVRGSFPEIDEKKKDPARQREMANQKIGAPMAEPGKDDAREVAELKSMKRSSGRVSQAEGTFLHGAKEPPAFRIVSSPEEWHRVSGFLQLQPDFSRERVVLIGPPHRPVDCASIRWRKAKDRILIELSPAAPDSPAPPGDCAVVIPTGRKRVEIVEPSKGPDEP